MPSRIAAVALIASLSGCALGPDFKRPDPPSAPGYGSAPQQGETAAVDGPGGNAQRFVAGTDIAGQWWTLFHSPKLDRLVEEALRANPNVSAAQAALRQAHELYLVQWAGYFPTVQGNFSAARAKNASNTIANPTVSPDSIYNLYTAQLSLSYAPDVFGATRRSVEAAKAQFESTRYQLEATYLTLSSNVVVTTVQ
jgi:outer membrane protein TolC